MDGESDSNNDRKLPSTARSLPIALIRAREKVMGPIREMLSNSGLTEQQWRILRVLDELGPLDSTKLSENASLLLPSQTRIVQTLVEKGLVTRQADPSDRRRQTVAITSSGQQIILDNLDEAQRIAAHIETVLGKETVDRLLDILEEFDRL
ncbi:homoprotocatechuate degradation operon regulator HpaR [Roseibium aggregatum]|uniref:Homoprotocatechuate degradation operon regulator HpaR n=1 Tax=Roseibium aggregatum TaxID=187304 RepID=A0A926NYL3_9HYPH|nr:homoprotocatechuate degradation operon regulator HpaR [Roseibium aggregatum]MBD1545668.1 homoprotocatechuate degradation operon regulator HpaR [Roseibium aggregatum]